MIDSHCHLNEKVLLEEVDKYIQESKENGVFELMVIGFNYESSLVAVELTKKYKNIYACIGIHPSDVKDSKKNDLYLIEELLKENSDISVGEIGLDYYWDKEDDLKTKQKEYFVKQIQLANKYKKPISIHCRDAYQDCYEILKNNTPLYGGVVHCYSGSVEMVDMFLNLGLSIGIGGTLTFKNNIKTKEVVKHIPLDRILLETDAPFLTPHPFRGKTNSSKYLYLVRDEIASLKNVSIELVDEVTSNNFRKMFLK